MKSLILAILVSIVLPGTASAHDFQQSIEKVVGEYLFDVGYDAITFRAGDLYSLIFPYTSRRRT